MVREMVRDGCMLELNSGENGDFVQPWCLVKLKLRYDGPSSREFTCKAGGVPSVSRSFDGKKEQIGTEASCRCYQFNI